MVDLGPQLRSWADQVWVQIQETPIGDPDAVPGTSLTLPHSSLGQLCKVETVSIPEKLGT